MIPLFVLDPDELASDRAGACHPQTQFLLASLRDLEESLAERGSRLVVVTGNGVEVVPRLVREWNADRVFAHRSVEPRERDRERRMHDLLGGKLDQAGVRLGKTYPLPIVDHHWARGRYLAVASTYLRRG